MEIKKWQETVDQWIKQHGVRYFDEMTNTLILTEEVGEIARLISRKYGEQSWKKKEDEQNADTLIKDEIVDILFVLTCLANQMDIDLTSALQQNIDKKTKRDNRRHHDNEKLLDS